MATINLSSEALDVQLSRGEKLAAIHGNVTVSRDRVASAQIVTPKFWLDLGFRVPGTGMPPFIVSGTYVKKGDKAFVSYFKGQIPVQITLTDAKFTRLIIGVDDLTAAEAFVTALSPANS